MYFSDLQTFMESLESTGELLRVTAQVDPYLEIAGIVNRACKDSEANRALLFEKVKGAKLPLVVNTFGSTHRTAAALGVDCVETLADKLKKDLEGSPERDSGQALLGLTQAAGNVQHLDNCDLPPWVACGKGLCDLPVLQSWPQDGGRYLTMGQTFTQGPDNKKQNCGMYRLQVVDEETALIRFHPGSGGGDHMQAWHACGKPMPIAIAFGGPPALTWCAGLSLPSGVTETAFTSYLTGQSIDLIRCRHSELFVPASAEIVIEGLVRPDDVSEEGPFGNHTGYYTEVSPAPIVKVQSVYRKETAVYPCTVVGPPPMENVFLAQANERILLALLQHDLPWVVDVHLPLEGIYHRAALVSIDQNSGPTTEINQSLRLSKLLKNSRLIILLDGDCDLHDFREIYWRVINADCWERNELFEGRTIDARKSTKRNRILF
jgi:4-hydroxy-3-polyprenylbenzoate decarboxylase